MTVPGLPARMRTVLFFHVAPLIIALRIIAGVTAASDEPQRQAVQRELMKLKQTWKSAVEQYRLKAEKSGFELKGGLHFQQFRILTKLLNNASSKTIQAESKRICAKQVGPLPVDSSDPDKIYDSILLEALVDRSIEQKDAPRLSLLLSHNCPGYIVYAPLEFRLADSEWPGAIQVLFDCYEKSKSAHAKKDIVVCLGRAFASLRESLPADSVFVEEAKRWYVKNRSKLKVNNKYPYLTAQPRYIVPPDKNLFVFSSK